MFWVEGGVLGEHHACNPQEAIGDGSEGASVRMATGSEGRITAATAGVMLGGNAGPMVDRSPQAAGTGLAHFETTRLAAPFCDRRDPG